MSLKRQTYEPAKHSHYVSLSNGCVYAAMTHESGYEDRNPADWRPATPEEKRRFLAGDDVAAKFEEVTFDLNSDVPPPAPAPVAFAPPPAPAPVAFAPPPAPTGGSED